MGGILTRSISEPIREGLTWSERWKGEDRGLIFCWERGRQLRNESPELAQCAVAGELPILVWQGGVEKKLASGAPKVGTLNYLAMWQGLRNEDLQVNFESVNELICSKTGQAVQFRKQT